MTATDDIRFYIAGKIATSDKPLEVINDIQKCLDELRRMYEWRQKDLNGIID